MTDQPLLDTHDLPDDEGAWPGPRSDGEASWALRRMAAAQAEVDRLTSLAEEDIATIRQWLTDAVSGPTHDLDFFRAHLVAYRGRLEQQDPGLPATYKLPGGDLLRRKGRVSVKVADEDAFLDWAESNETTAVKRTPLVAPLKSAPYQLVDGKVVTADGEVVPGVEAVTADDALSVRVAGEPKVAQR